MYLYQKYIYKVLLFPFFVITLSITGVSWLVQSIRYLEIILNKGARLLDFIELTVYLIPFLLFITLPISLFFTIYYTYRKLSHDREITALYSLGIDRIKIIKTFFLFSTCVVLLHYVISIYLLPMSMYKFKNLKFEIDHNSIVNLLQFNTFISKINNITLYIEKKEKDNLLRNIFIYNLKNPEKDITFIANSGKFYNTNSGIQLTLYNGSKLEFDHKNKKYSLVKFSKHSMSSLNTLEGIKSKFKENAYEFSISELLFSNDLPQNKISRFRAQGHFRLLWPFTSISIIMSMLFFLTQYEQIRKSVVKANVYTFISALFIILATFSLYTLNYSSQKYYVIMYMLNILVSCIVCFLLISTAKKCSFHNLELHLKIGYHGDNGVVKAR